LGWPPTSADKQIHPPLKNGAPSRTWVGHYPLIVLTRSVEDPEDAARPGIRFFEPGRAATSTQGKTSAGTPPGARRCSGPLGYGRRVELFLGLFLWFFLQLFPYPGPLAQLVEQRTFNP